MGPDSLHTLVSGVIWRAEQLEAQGLPGAANAWAEVSLLEERLACMIPVSEPEGRIARRGAVRAALKAGDPLRGHDLAQFFLADPGASDALRAALLEMLNEDALALATRFRFAARQHPILEARELARRIHKSGAFGLAA